MNAKELGVQPAYPLNPEQICPPTIGLTKRELFAAMMLAQIVGNNEFSPDRREEECASDAMRYADALLTELAKEQP